MLVLQTSEEDEKRQTQNHPGWVWRFMSLPWAGQHTGQSFSFPFEASLNHRHERASQCVLCYPEPLQCKKKAFCLRVTDGGTFPLLEEPSFICGKLAGLDGAEKDSPTCRQHCINTDNTTLSSVLSTRISTLSQEHGGNCENMKKKKTSKEKSIFFCCILRFSSGVCTYSISQTLLGTGINWGQCKSSGD